MIDGKRAFDLACCLVVGPVAALLGTVIAVFVWVRSGRPVLYRGRRMGRGGIEFDILKFRTMTTDGSGPGITSGGDPRITPTGRWLRRTKLDELPQLLNVLRGEMSLVGPRPEDPRYAAHYRDRFAEVLSVRPGITDPASLEFLDEAAMLAASADPERVYVEAVLPVKLRLAAEYVDQATPARDLQVLCATLRTLLFGRRPSIRDTHRP